MGGFDLRFRRTFRHMDTWLFLRSLRLLLVFPSRLVGNELSLDFVWMDFLRSLAESFNDIVLAGRLLNFKEIVKCHPRTFGSLDFILKAKDFVICGFRG